MQDFEGKRNIKVSIIIPVYNREGTLERCVDSLLRQITDEVEIILVDDGSNDNTYKILEEYRNDEYITIAYRKHGGVSSARNYGLAIAAGEYISFVDSDDFVGDGYIDILLEAAKDSSDLAAFDCWYRIDAKGKVWEDTTGIMLRGEQPAERMYPFLLAQVLNNVWGKLFKNVIVRKYEVQFDETMVISEDFMFVKDYLGWCKTVSIYDRIPYYYEHNPNGTCRVKPQYIRDWNKMYNAICGFMEKKQVILDDPIWNLQLVRSRFLRYECSIIVGLYNSGNFSKEEDERLMHSRLYQDVTGEKYAGFRYRLMKELIRRRHWRILSILFKIRRVD